MSNYVFKKFGPSLFSRFVLGLFGFSLLFVAGFCYLELESPANDFVSSCFLVLSAAFLYYATQVFTITDSAVHCFNIFRRRTLLFSDVKRTQVKYCENRNPNDSFVLVIETERASVEFRGFLDETEMRAVAAYILEQIKEKYPENYDYVREDRYNAERFWR